MGFMRRSEDAPEEPLPSFEELAAEARRNGTDAKALLKSLARKFEADLGEAVKVTWGDNYGRNRQNPFVEYLTIALPGQDHYSLWAEGGGIDAKVRGDSVPLADWFVGLHQTIAISTQEQTAGIEAGLAHIEGRPLLDEVEALPESPEVPALEASLEPSLER
jgi:hypothetical protein